MARDPAKRIRMPAGEALGRTALTEYKVVNRFLKHTYLRIRIGTGRTHQIRVHMQALGHPVAGDRLYGPPGNRRARVESPLPAELAAYLETLG